MRSPFGYIRVKKGMCRMHSGIYPNDNKCLRCSTAIVSAEYSLLRRGVGKRLLKRKGIIKIIYEDGSIRVGNRVTDLCLGVPNVPQAVGAPLAVEVDPKIFLSPNGASVFIKLQIYHDHARALESNM